MKETNYQDVAVTSKDDKARGALCALGRRAADLIAAHHLRLSKLRVYPAMRIDGSPAHRYSRPDRRSESNIVNANQSKAAGVPRILTRARQWLANQWTAHEARLARLRVYDRSRR